MTTLSLRSPVQVNDWSLMVGEPGFAPGCLSPKERLYVYGLDTRTKFSRKCRKQLNSAPYLLGYSPMYKLVKTGY